MGIRVYLWREVQTCGAWVPSVLPSGEKDSHDGLTVSTVTFVDGLHGWSHHETQYKCTNSVPFLVQARL